MRRWWLPVCTVLVIAAGATALLATRPGGPVTGGGSGQLVARFVDEGGQPLARTTVRLGRDRSATTDGGGWLRTSLGGGPQLLTAAAAGHLSRTQAVQPGVPTEIRLTSQAEATLSLRFGGDVMFGRRFYDPDEDGHPDDGLLHQGASVADHAHLLDAVAPLLQDADVAVVNLETPLLQQPWIDPAQGRPTTFQQTKASVLASAPESAEALLRSGVDVVSLGNDHVNDASGAGLASTLQTLDRVRLPHFGAGLTIDEAWRPAVVERRGHRVAFLSCTTITGVDQPIPYVATVHQGGAARCTADRLTRAVRDARTAADVVVMIHGGEEYRADQGDLVRQFSSVAALAGAAVVVDSHPSVVGGISQQGSTVVAEALGNLLSDQTVWPTFLSYLVRVDLRGGRPVLTTADPLFLRDFVPRPTVGLLAGAAGRRAAGLVPGSAVELSSPGATLGSGAPRPARREQGLQRGAVAHLAPGWWVSGGAGGSGLPASVRLGEDLLWTGSFEAGLVGPSGLADLGWSTGPYSVLTGEAACEGTVGLRMSRAPASDDDVIAAPAHRQLVTAGSRVSVLVRVRSASSGSSLELHWFADTRGASSATLRVPIPAGDHRRDDCELARLDAVVPEGVVAAQPTLRLAPRGNLQEAAHLSVDDVQLVAWAPAWVTGRRFDVVESTAPARVAFEADTSGSPEPLAFGGTSG